jgi:DNA-binding response OmpR family regulator
MRVLLVDDDQLTLKAISCFLEYCDAEILAMTESWKAARLVAKQHFDVMIFDVRMPSPDGLELTRLARQSSTNSRAPIILVTGYDDLETRRKGLEAGVTCFAAKPVSPHNIRGIVHALCGSVPHDAKSKARVPFHTTVTCCRDSSRAKKVLVESLSLGQDEMLLEPSGGLKVGQEMDLQFEIPSLGRPLLLRAKVDRLEPPDRIVVRFLDVTRSDYEAIQSQIALRLQG